MSPYRTSAGTAGPEAEPLPRRIPQVLEALMDLGQTITRARMMGLGSPSWGAHDAELCVDAGTFDGLLMLMRNEGQRVEPLPWATRTMRMTLADGTCLVLREYPCTEGAQ